MANKVKQQGAIRPILASAPTGLSGVFYYDSGLSKLRFYNGSSFVELADFGQLQSDTSGSSGATKVKGDNKAYTNISGLSTFTLQDFLDRIDLALGSAGGSSFSDADFEIYDDATPTKKIKFQASGISASTTRTLTMPDADVDLGNLTNSNISASAAIVYSKLSLSNSIVNADINASAAIAYSKLSLSDSIVNADINSAAAIAYSKLSLSNSIVNADINASAAIAYSKLNLALSVVDGDISAAAAITRSKLASGTANRVVVNDGSGVLSDAAAITAARVLISDANGIPTHSSVTSTTLGYLDATSSIQTQLDAKIDDSEKGANNGVATLDAGGKIPAAQLPSTVMEYKGTWNASTNTPTLADGTGDAGDVYVVSVAGTQDLGSGSITFAAGDWVIYSGTIWQKSINSNAVVSVNSQTGVVVLDTDDISEGSTNKYFSDEAAQDAVGAMVANSSKVSLTYVDGTPSLTADIVAGSLVNADISASAAIVYSKLSLSNSIVNADISASAAIAYSKLSLSDSIVNADINSAAAIAYSKLSLSNSIVNADINASAAIAYSKLNLSASIVNADIAAAAAIAFSKMEALTASRVLVSDGSGVVSASSVTSTTLGYLDATSSIQTQLDDKLENVVEDTTPQLGGDLDPNGKAITNTVRFGASAANSVEEDYLHAESLTASTTAVLSNLTFDSKVYKSLMIEYTARNGNARRTGSIWVAADNTSGVAASTAQCFHEELDTSDLGLTWSVALNGDNVEVSYTTGAGTYVANLHVKRFKA